MKYDDETIPLRYRITTYLNKFMMGFLEGTSDGVRDKTVRDFKRVFNIDLLKEDVKIVSDVLYDPYRPCWSIHVDHAGEHYESVIVNLNYDTGWED